MWSPFPPSDASLDAFRQQQQAFAPSYPEQGATRGEFPPGYDHDRNETVIGQGREVFDRAAAALLAWRMFPSWTRVFPGNAAPAPGGTVVTVFRLLGHWRSAARIIYTLDEGPSGNSLCRRGFAYGTLPGHVERGEECFAVSLRQNGDVVYELKAFSRPRHPAARLFYPLARRWQRKFVRDSQAAMRAAVR